MNPLKSVVGTLALGFVVALGIMLVMGTGEFNLWSFTVWLHVLFGVIWVGLLYYFNFVQVPALAAANADSEGPGPAAINKYVAPRALAWFRWGALGTWLADTLVRAGVGHLTLVDRDVVDLSNLQRQHLFDESDVDAPKAIAAANRLAHINGEVLRVDGGTLA